MRQTCSCFTCILEIEAQSTHAYMHAEHATVGEKVGASRSLHDEAHPATQRPSLPPRSGSPRDQTSAQGKLTGYSHHDYGHTERGEPCGTEWSIAEGGGGLRGWNPASTCQRN